MKRIAVFPGSFDPFTKGHESIITKSYDLFDEIVIAFGVNTSKNYLFDIEKRINHVKKIYKDYPKVNVIQYSGLTTELCKQLDAKYIIRGVRNTIDFEYEKPIAEINHQIGDVETILFYTNPNVNAISSTIIREIYKMGGNLSQFVTNSEDLS